MKQETKIVMLLSMVGFPFIAFADFLPGSPTELLSILLLIYAGNLIINSVIIFVLIPDERFKTIFRGYSILKILGLTVLGLIADLFGSAIGSGLASVIFHQSIWGQILFSGLMVWILVALNFYWIYSKEVSDQKKTRIIKAVIFGFISNPFWLSLVGWLFTR